ncbi:Triosephosphate isomerase [hydrothermal vent metagenome]|uniref:triose-phosphate isomerase n=1 Tax=hydrothermal vent metagenome TaxID=652676 RepID=A0A3B0Z4I2_9ZZZZ
MRRPLVAGNWKMNGTREGVIALVEGIKAGLDGINTEVLVCPPAIFIDTVGSQLEGSEVKLGAQNICQEPESGAFTGELSAAMLTEFGCRYAIIGHSERRHVYGESDKLIAERVAAAVAGNVTPIFCIGELLEERENGTTEQVIAQQLDAVLNLDNGVALLKETVLAYEPVWAIGTGKTASPEQAQEVHAFIRSHLAKQDEALAAGIKILYGGSVNAANAENLFGMPDIDGGLIGGASLKVNDFLAVCKAAG